MKRPDWRSGLMAALADHRRHSLTHGLVWGQYDCALLAADCEAAQTGYDAGGPYRGRYKTRIGGLRLVRADGFEDYVAVFASRLRELDAVGLAQTGDIVVIDGSPGKALGVVDGPNIHAYAIPKSGKMEDARLGVAPLLSALRAFRVE